LKVKTRLRVEKVKENLKKRADLDPKHTFAESICQDVNRVRNKEIQIGIKDRG